MTCGVTYTAVRQRRAVSARSSREAENQAQASCLVSAKKAIGIALSYFYDRGFLVRGYSLTSFSFYAKFLY